MVSLISPLTVHAQDCGVQFLDQSARIEFKREEICKAAGPLMSQGIEVYVFMTDEDPKSEDEWFAILDRVEINDWEIYRPASDTFKKSALAIEFTTNTTNPWGNVGFGEQFNSTPLNGRPNQDSIRGLLRSSLKAGDHNAAVVQTLNTIYSKAFPSPTPTPVPQQVVVQEGPKTEVTVDTAPVVQGLGTFLWWLFVLALIVVFGWFLVIPGVKLAMALFKHQRHIADLRGRVADLLNDAQQTIPGEDPEGTMIYTLWASLGGKVSDRDSEVRTLISRAQRSLGIGYEVYLQLKRGSASWWNLVKVQEQVQAWETLYLTVTGRTESILNMTGEEQANLLDPILVIEPEEISDQLVAQIEDVRRNLRGGGKLKIVVRIVDQSTTDELGVLGSIDRVKQAIHDLRIARENARPMMEALQTSLTDQRTQPLPDGVNDAQAYGHVDGLIANAVQLLTEQKWLDAVETVHAAEDALEQTKKVLTALANAAQAMAEVVVPKEERMPELSELLTPVVSARETAIQHLSNGEYVDSIEAAQHAQNNCSQITEITAAFAAALKKSDEQLAHVVSIAAQGFRLDSSAQPFVGEVTDDIQVVQTTLVAGDYVRAAEMVRELERDAAHALKLAEALVVLQLENEESLKRLAKEVARVEAYRSAVALPAWQQLQGYPRSNWEGVATNHDDAQATLRFLFDDPANAEDLASQIDRLNDMDTQNFQGAHDMLDRAFSDLQKAEAQLTATVQQLSAVQKTEAEVTDRIATVRKAIDRAQEFETASDPLIDQAVQLSIDEADRLHYSATRHTQVQEYMRAADELAEARRLAEEAYESAKQQVKIIRDLYDRVDQTRRTAEQRLSSARQTVNDSRLPAGLIQNALSQVISGDASYNKAKQREEAIAGLEDHALAEALQDVVESYDQVGDFADQAINAFEDAKRQYEQSLSTAQNAVESAEGAIAAARRTMSDSDAGSAGSSALSRAQSMLPSTPTYGTTMDSLLRIENAAREAERNAETAQREAQQAINAAEEARAEARRRREAEERRQREEAQRQRDAAEASRRAAERARSSSYGSSSSSRSSSFGSSIGSRSSSFGSPSGRR